jgi:hypothetical protein
MHTLLPNTRASFANKQAHQLHRLTFCNSDAIQSRRQHKAYTAPRSPLLDLNDAYVHVHVYVRIGDAEKYKHVRRYVHRVCTGTHTQEL